MQIRKPGAEWPDLALENTCDAVIAADGDGRVVVMNHAAEELTGFTRKTAVGMPLKDIFRLVGHASALPTTKAFQQKSAPRHLHRAVITSRTGREIMVDGAACPIITGRGVIGLTLSFHDASECLTEERAAIDRQKIGAIGTLAGRVSRDFSNWLSAISGHASSIADNLIPNTRPHEEALRILEVVEQANTLTKRLQSVARVGGIKAEPKIERTPIEEVVKDALSLVEGTFVRQKINFKTKGLDTARHVMVDAGQLLDCLMNLFLNTAESLPQGGDITVVAGDKEEAGKTYVILTVRDTGKGLDKESLERIFQPFFTFCKGRAMTSSLAFKVIHRAVERWGGFIRIKTAANRGTTISLYLPKAAEPSESREKEKATTSAGVGTILLVDDDTELLIAMRTTLREAGFRVIEASSGEEAIALYKRNSEKINISVIDVIMPDKDGKAVLKEILKADPAAAIIMTSGFSRDYVRGYLERGAWAFIQKPYDRNQLLALVRRTLDQKLARQKASSPT